MRTRVLAFLSAVLITAMPTGIEAAGFPPLFNTVAYQNDSLEALPQWRRVLKEIEEEKTIYHACATAEGPCLPRALLAWQSMIKSQSDQTRMMQLRAVNRFVNRWAPASDLVNHHQPDYWSSPLTFLRQSGDCEDYAIMKYASLRQMGFEADQLRIVIVRDVLRDLAHAVLAVHLNGKIYILDNLFQAVLPQTKVRQYLPYYSVNEQARWAHLPSDTIMLSSATWAVMPSADSHGNSF